VLKAASTASRILGLIKRNFKNTSRDSFNILYKTFVRPHLEYCVQSWSPYLQKDIECLEKVQRRATKLVASLSKNPYKDRLVALNLTTLKQRRIRGDLIETYKILTGKEDMAANQFFCLNSSGHDCRGHTLKLYHPSIRTQLRQNFFSVRVIPHWNALLQHVIDAPSINSFKQRLVGSSRYWIQTKVQRSRSISIFA
jgi:hypothetical protein